MALAASLLVSASGVANGQLLAQQQQTPAPFPNPFQGSPEEQAACAPDSTKFCKQFEPDPLQVLGCLQRNRSQISAACQRVLRNRGV